METGLAAIKTTALTKAFGDSKAVDSLTLEIKKGELFGLVGPDGAGKTTTMRLLTAIMEPSAGEAWVAGHSILREGERIKEKIGYMSQRFGLYEDLTVMENIVFYADLYDVPHRERPARIDRLLGFSNLTPFKDRLAGKLSGGMKQKLALMCTLIPRPKLLLLDEPTTGVDPISRREFWEILQSLVREGVTVLVSTPYMDEAEWCTRVGLLREGRLVADDTPVRLKERFPYTLVEVRSSDASLLAGLGGSEGAADFHRLGERVRISFRDRESAESLSSRLGGRADVRMVAASIEDVYLAGDRMTADHSGKTGDAG